MLKNFQWLKKISTYFFVVVGVIFTLLVLSNILRYQFFMKPLVQKEIESRKHFLLDIKNYDFNRFIEGKYMYFDIDYNLKGSCDDASSFIGYLCLDPYMFFVQRPNSSNCKAYSVGTCKNGSFTLFPSKYEQRFDAKLNKIQESRLRELIKNHEINTMQIKVEESKAHHIPRIIDLIINGKSYKEI